MKPSSYLTGPAAAVGLGLFLLVVETCRHFDVFPSLPGSWTALPIPDWIAGALLVYAGTANRNQPGRRRDWLVAAWAFALSLLVSAFFAHLEEWASPAPDEVGLSDHFVTVAVGCLALIAFTGFAATLRTGATTRDP